MSRQEHSTGVLLVNLGSPQTPDAAGVASFLKPFLSDKRVVTIPHLFWLPLLYGVIVPFRSRKVAKLYQQIWLEDGSPLRVISQKQQDKLERKLADQKWPVTLSMTYGEPSVANGLDVLKQQGVNRVIILPLYPQFSASTTAAVFDTVAAALKNCYDLPEIVFIRDYHQHPLYIQALAKSVRSHWEHHGQGDKLVLSFHGVPKRFSELGDPYETQCHRTVELLAQELDLAPEKYQICFQSRFGKEEWIQPYTEQTLEGLPEKGVKSVDIICPAFAADCLETLEEIAEQNRNTFLQAGGEHYRYISCLNDSDDHIELFASLAKENG